jgi:AcrR family transcriptional regulator
MTMYSFPMPTGRAPRAVSETPQRARRARGSLNQAIIVAAAFAVAERDGLAAVTFQALGAELGAHPTAIYRHFRDKDELVLGLIDALHAETLRALDEPTGDWAADLTAIARTSHAVFLKHPAVGQLAASRTARREHEFRIVDRIIGCLRRSGLSDADAARYYRIVGDFVLGYSALDAGFAALDPQTRAADLRAWEVEYRTVPAAEYPHIAAVSGSIPQLDDPANFDTAVELMIEAIGARAAQRKRRTSGSTRRPS